MPIPDAPQNQEMNLAWQFIAETSTSIFLTGKAGTGKTTFLRKLRQLSPKRMVVLAPTGVAAINAGGQTIHSFFQFPLGPYIPGAPETGNDTDKRFRMSQQKKNIIRTLDLLVIDEISMVRADLLDRIDDILRRYRDRSRPFGGVQLLLIGDLMQLAPVTKNDEWQLLSPIYDTPYFFSSIALRKHQYLTIELTRVFRQQDPTFIHLLEKIRDGKPDRQTIETLNSRYIPDFDPKGNQWIRLTTHNGTARDYNLRRIQALPAPSVQFHAKVDGDFPETSYPADRTLIIKEGTQVMFIKNDTGPEHAYFNGKIGTVTAINPEYVEITCTGDTTPIKATPQTWENIKYTIDPETKTIQEKIAGTFTQLPLRPAWAITVHKSQGLTFDHAILDINASFAHGQAYVALSRCRSLDGLILSAPIDPSSIIADTTVNSYIDASRRDGQNAVNALPEMRLKYTVSLLDQLYDFTPIATATQWLIRVLEEHLSQQAPVLLHDFKATIPLLETHITTIARRFSTQYRDEIQRNGTPAHNPHLAGRIQRSCQYFTEKIAEIYPDQLLLTRAVLNIENKQTAQTYSNALLNLRQAISDKTSLLAHMAQTPFTSAAYLGAKAKITLSANTTATRTKKSTKQAKRENKPKPTKGDSARETLALLRSGLTPEAIANTRNLAPSTIYGHLSEAINTGALTVTDVVAPDRRSAILAAADTLASSGTPTIRAIDLLPHLPGYTTPEIAFILRHRP